MSSFSVPFSFAPGLSPPPVMFRAAVLVLSMQLSSAAGRRCSRRYVTTKPDDWDNCLMTGLWCPGGACPAATQGCGSSG
jgi:hypothetical protein